MILILPVLNAQFLYALHAKLHNINKYIPFIFFFFTDTAKPQAKRKKSTESSDSYATALDSVATIKKDLALKAQSQEMAEDSSEDSSQDARRKKKARTTFTGRQIFELEKQFEVKKYLSSSERAEMAKLLNVTETQVSKTDSQSANMDWMF